MRKVLDGGNVLLIAPTGTGKTEAALLPVLGKALDSASPGVSILYVTPLRALNRDMLDRVSALCSKLGLRVGVRHADTSQSERRAQALRPPDVMITTPESAQILLYGKRTREMLRNVKWLIVDEVHELVASERGLQFSIVMERLARVAEFQRIGLSATVGGPKEVLGYLTGARREGAIVDVSQEERMEIEVEVPEPDGSDRKLAERLGISDGEAAAIHRVSKEVEKRTGVLLFVNTRRTAENLAYLMRNALDVPFSLHHGSLARNIRMRAEEAFKSGEIRMLVCTSSLELGIDIGSIDLVIQYGSPRQAMRMIQRVGRSGHRLGMRPHGLVISPGLLDAVESDVLSERAKAHKVERISVRENSLASLANQLVAESCATKRFDPDEFYETVKQAYPYRNLERKEFDEVVGALASIRMLWHADDAISISSRSRDYFVNTVSMIPDESKVRVVDAITNEDVGTLDETFARTLNQGETFIIQGKAREVISVDKDTLVSQDVTESGMVPTWVGEEIPVTAGVARDVLLRTSSGHAASRGVPSPDGKEISERSWSIETEGRDMVMMLPLGTRGGMAMAHLIGSALAGASGETIPVNPTAYGVVLTLPRGATPERVLEILRETEDVGTAIANSLRRSHLFRFRFIQAARKFGVISPGADLMAVNMEALITSYKGTPLDRDVMNKVLLEDMDVRTVQALVDAYRRRETSVRTRQGFSKLAECLIEEVALVLYPERAKKVIAGLIKNRLQRRKVTLICMNCSRAMLRRVSELLPRPVCPRCRSPMLAVCYDTTKSEKLLKRKRLSQDDRKELKRMRLSADLVRVFGREAIIALSAHGIGEATAARILGKRRQTEEEFYMDIVDAEIAYERTHRFWQ
jgi:ATP-dependent Lhr-like helicase